MEARSILTLVLAAAGIAAAGTVAAGEHRSSRAAAHDPAQARLTVAQAVTIAEVLGKGTVREVEWQARAEAFEIRLAAADGGHRKVLVEAYGGRLVDPAAR